MTTDSTPATEVIVKTIYDKELDRIEIERKRIEDLKKLSISLTELATKNGYKTIPAMIAALDLGAKPGTTLTRPRSKASPKSAHKVTKRVKKKKGKATQAEIDTCIQLITEKKTGKEIEKLTGRSIGWINGVKKDNKLSKPRK